MEFDSDELEQLAEILAAEKDAINKVRERTKRDHRALYFSESVPGWSEFWKD